MIDEGLCFVVVYPVIWVGVVNGMLLPAGAEVVVAFAVPGKCTVGSSGMNFLIS